MFSKCPPNNEVSIETCTGTNTILFDFDNSNSLKNSSCLQRFNSYRSTFSLPRGAWKKIRIPWSKFDAHGWGTVENNKLDPSTLRRIGVVSIGKEVDIKLALSSVGFYKNK